MKTDSAPIPPFTEERRIAVNTRELKGGEVPLPDEITPEQLAKHIETMVCSFWDWPGNDYSNAELLYAISLGALRRMRDLARVRRVPSHDCCECADPLVADVKRACELRDKMQTERDVARTKLDHFCDVVLNMSHFEAQRLAERIKAGR